MGDEPREGLQEEEEQSITPGRRGLVIIQRLEVGQGEGDNSDGSYYMSEEGQKTQNTDALRKA